MRLRKICGPRASRRGARLSQLIGSVRPKGAPPIGLHADNSWFPAPFPEWDFLVTGCWATDEFTQDGGCTLVIPGSHRAASHPTREARETLAAAREQAGAEGVIWMITDGVFSMEGDIAHLAELRELDLADLSRILQGDRVGLVLYAGGAFRRLPLTTDLAAMQSVVGDLDIVGPFVDFG